MNSDTTKRSEEGSATSSCSAYEFLAATSDIGCGEVFYLWINRETGETSALPPGFNPNSTKQKIQKI